MKMNIKWFNDAAAERTHAVLSEEMNRVCQKLFPGFILSHTGMYRDEEIPEVQIKLHLRPIRLVVEQDKQINQRIEGPV
jgi:hypothetical protein